MPVARAASARSVARRIANSARSIAPRQLKNCRRTSRDLRVCAKNLLASHVLLQEGTRPAGRCVMTEKGSDRDPLADLEQHFRECDAWVNGPWTTNFQQLVDRGIELPHPDTIDDAS